jgi:phospholipase D1/2
MSSGMSMRVDTCGPFPERWSRLASQSGFLIVSVENGTKSAQPLTWPGWLSPELYLRRPPAKNEQYRIDNMLKAAAERGVKVNIIVYKEVTPPTKLLKSPLLNMLTHPR